MSKKVPKKILRIERNLFVNLIKKFWPPTPRRRRFFWTAARRRRRPKLTGAPPPTQWRRRTALVVTRLDPGPCISHPPPQPFIEGTERVSMVKVLEFLLNTRLSLPWQTKFHRFWALALPLCSRWDFSGFTVSNRKSSTTVASILYATPAWWRFEGQRNRLNLERLAHSRNTTRGLPAFRLSKHWILSWGGWSKTVQGNNSMPNPCPTSSIYWQAYMYFNAPTWC